MGWPFERQHAQTESIKKLEAVNDTDEGGVLAMAVAIGKLEKTVEHIGGDVADLKRIVSRQSANT